MGGVFQVDGLGKWLGGFNNTSGMYKKDVGQGVPYAYMK
jgi:hypothetical protein